MEKKVMGRPRTPFDEGMHSEIVHYREVLKLSKYKCAQLINVSNTAYSRYEVEKDNFIGTAKQIELLDRLKSIYKARTVIIK